MKDPEMIQFRVTEFADGHDGWASQSGQCICFPNLKFTSRRQREGGDWKTWFTIAGRRGRWTNLQKAYDEAAKDWL